MSDLRIEGKDLIHPEKGVVFSCKGKIGIKSTLDVVESLSKSENVIGGIPSLSESCRCGSLRNLCLFTLVRSKNLEPPSF